MDTSYPLLPLRDIVVFPGRWCRCSSDVRNRSRRSKGHGGARRSAGAHSIPHATIPTRRSLRSGVVAQVLQMLKLPDGTLRVHVEGMLRVKLEELVDVATIHRRGFAKCPRAAPPHRGHRDDGRWSSSSANTQAQKNMDEDGDRRSRDRRRRRACPRSPRASRSRSRTSSSADRARSMKRLEMVMAFRRRALGAPGRGKIRGV